MTDITRRRGDTYADEYTLKSKGTGLPINITGYAFTLTVDPSAAPADASNNLFSLAGTIVDAAAGRVEFAPSALQADQAPGTYYFDVQMVDGAGRVRTVDAGKYKFVQDITKS